MISTMKHGMEAVARLRTGEPAPGGHYEAGPHKMEAGTYSSGVYGVDRPSAIISLDPMLSRAQALLSSEPTTYTGYQGLYPGHTTNTVSPLLSQTAPSPSPSQENLQL